MAAPLIPWEPCNFPEEIQSELNRRKTARSLRFVSADQGGWDNADGDWKKYRGPMSPWVRFCSNGMGREFDDNGNKLQTRKPGFVFYGGKDFYKAYGFGGGKGDPSIIGYLPDNNNTPHTIDNDLSTSDYPVHVPPPEIEKIQLTVQKEHYRRAMVEWTCFSKKQLEYMTPYFLVPGISAIIEFGWNHYDPQSLLNLADTKGLEKIFNNPYPLYTKHILKSRGNYDVIFGIITHFEWSVEGNKIKCKTEITSKDRIYSGLVIDSSSTDQKEGEDKVTPLGNLTEFVDKVLTKFKAVKTSGGPMFVPELREFVRYVSHHHPNNWKDYVYGVFYGRDLEDAGNPLQPEANKKKDFDYVNGKNAELWLNLGLVIEAVNFHSAPLQGMAGKEMFRVDIDDCVIGGHPNMISSDGTVCLIPNASAPKYFYGLFGPALTKSTNYSESDWGKLQPSTEKPGPILKRVEAEKKGALPDYRLRTVCQQGQGPTRDDLDKVINWIRYSNAGSGTSYAFPFKSDEKSAGDKPYPAKYAGYLKNIYVSLAFLKSLLDRSDEIKTYPRFIEKILEGVNAACGNFWDLRLVDTTGAYNVPEDSGATMKISDYKFMYFANRGTVYTFDYMDADSLLLGMSFKPTLSNAAAIRSMFASTNNPDKRTTLTNGTNELLDYHFKDRLILEQDRKEELPKVTRDSENYKETMRDLQQIEPCNGSYQITNKQDGKIIIRRLVLPDREILQMLLDDSDEKNNPKYTGIMPGIQANFTIQGIGGIRTFMMFLVRNLPEPYSHKNIVFRVVDVQDSIEAGKWTTTITAGIIPLRDYIKQRLGVTD